MHSEAELSRKLSRRGYEQDEITEVIASCVRLGYLNDAAFAMALVERRTASRGAAAMAAELRNKGVRREALDAALAPINRETEIDAAVGLFARHGGSGPDMSERELLDKIGARLQRRGYGPQVIREACRRYLALSSPD